MAIRSYGATKENRSEGRSEEDLRVWKRLRLQGRMPLQSMRLQTLQLLIRVRPAGGAHTFKTLT